MKRLLKTTLVFLLAMGAIDAAAQAIGRVLVAAGQVSVERQGATQSLAAGSELLVGDTVVTGAASNAQLAFTDNSLVALRESSRFAMEQYRYQDARGPDSLVFNLLRGGLRTITGAIGARRLRDDYIVKTKMASLGIRGTQYSLRYCEADCVAPDGAVAANGTYGGVFNGAVGVYNNAGEVVFGRDEYFFVADINTIPQPLLGPPSFLADRLPGMAKSAAKSTSEPAAREAAAVATSGAQAGESAPPVPAFIATETLGPGGAPVVAAAAPRIAFAFSHSLIELNGGPATYGGAVAAQSPPLTLTMNGTGPTQTLVAFDFNPAFARTGSPGTGGIDMQGFDPASGLHWGRWVNGSVVVGAPDQFLAPGTQVPPTGVHYMYGSATPETVLATKSGTFSFVDAAGTTPTNSNGATATSFTFGPMSVNFTARTANLSSIVVTFPAATWSYSNVAFAMHFGPQVAHLDAFAYNIGSCVGTGCGGSQGPNNATIDSAGVFVGSSGNFLAMSLQGFSGANITNNRVAWGAVRVYRCPTCQ